MRTLAAELGAWLDRNEPTGAPRVYVDANVPAGVVAFMRHVLRWDVLFVVEHDDLRRASDVEHFRLARQMNRTLMTLDRDYFDDHRFPPEQSGGVVVLSAPDEQQLTRLLRRFAPRLQANGSPHPHRPFEGRKLDVHPEIAPPRRRKPRRR
ncbi:MAG: DUF5615 family PIN-like protein [Vicinamibacterales bacterium]